MDKLPKKPFSKIHSPSTGLPVPTTAVESVQVKNVLETVSKWVPLICAGSAIGISIFALKEIKNTRMEIMNLKKEQYTAPNNDKLEKKMELLEKQLNKITEFLKTSQHSSRHSSSTRRPSSPDTVHGPEQRKDPKIVKVNVVPEEVKIINEEPTEDDEYEEIEVTDDDEPGGN
jgi:hypothetical protein